MCKQTQTKYGIYKGNYNPWSSTDDLTKKMRKFKVTVRSKDTKPCTLPKKSLRTPVRSIENRGGKGEQSNPLEQTKTKKNVRTLV